MLLPEDLDALLCLKNRLDQSPADVVMMRYNTGFDSRGNPTFSLIESGWCAVRRDRFGTVGYTNIFSARAPELQ